MGIGMKMVNHVEYKKVTSKNKIIANEIISHIFPEDVDCARVCFDLSVAPKEQWKLICVEADNILKTHFTEQFLPINKLEYFILKINEDPVGVSGVYFYDDEPNEAWVGWLGIKPLNRGKGYGNLLLQHVIDMAIKNGCSILRLWSTDSSKLHVAHCMYEKSSFTWQEDPCDLPTYEGEKYRICSLNLQDSKAHVTPWYGYRSVGLAGSPIQPGLILDRQRKTDSRVLSLDKEEKSIESERKSAVSLEPAINHENYDSKKFRKNILSENNSDEINSRHIFMSPEQVDEFNLRLGGNGFYRIFFGQPLKVALNNGYKVSIKGYFESTDSPVMEYTAAKVKDILLSQINHKDPLTVVDLFAGAGQAAYAFKKSGFFVSIVELDSITYKYSCENLSRAGMDVTSYHRDACEFISKSKENNNNFSAVFLDPPWNGRYQYDLSKPFYFSHTEPDAERLIRDSESLAPIVVFKAPLNIHKDQVWALGRALGRITLFQNQRTPGYKDEHNNAMIYFIKDNENVAGLSDLNESLLIENIDIPVSVEPDVSEQIIPENVHDTYNSTLLRK